MPAGTDYTPAIVIINRHEPEGEATSRLLELADEKGYDHRTVEAKRGEHDAALSFRVPEEVAEAFNADRADRWSSAETVVDTDRTPPAGVDGDAFAAEQAQRAETARTENAAAAEEKNTTPARAARQGKQRQE